MLIFLAAIDWFGRGKLLDPFGTQPNVHVKFSAM